jgi:hypothetical protein
VLIKGVKFDCFLLQVEFMTRKVFISCVPKNFVCGIIYRQHNSPEYFQKYFKDKIEEIVSSGKAVYIMGDFNVA